MKRLEKFKLILEEFEKARTNFPGIRRIDALKRAIIKVKFIEEGNYEDNGDKIDDLIGSHNPSDWTY